MSYDEHISRMTAVMREMTLDEAKELLHDQSSRFAVTFTRALNSTFVQLDENLSYCYKVLAATLLRVSKSEQVPTLQDCHDLLFTAHLRADITDTAEFHTLEEVMYEQLVVKQTPNYSLFTELMLKLRDAQGIY